MEKLVTFIKNNKNILSGLTVLTTLGFGGFGERQETITQCKSVAKKFWLAEYSEIEVSVDGEGNVSTDTDSWTEPASEVFKVVSIDGELMETSHDIDVTQLNGYFIPSNNPVQWPVPNSSDLDRVTPRSTGDLSVSTYDPVSADYGQFSDPITKTRKCINMLRQSVTIKTWYSISYSSDFI